MNLDIGRGSEKNHPKVVPQRPRSPPLLRPELRTRTEKTLTGGHPTLLLGRREGPRASPAKSGTRSAILLVLQVSRKLAQPLASTSLPPGSRLLVLPYTSVASDPRLRVVPSSTLSSTLTLPTPHEVPSPQAVESYLPTLPLRPRTRSSPQLPLLRAPTAPPRSPLV